MNKNKVKQTIKFSLIFFVIAIIISFAIFTVLKYEVEGEKNMPFQLGKIIVISSAKTVEPNEIEKQQQTTNENYIWEEKVIQTNDVYIYLDKNTNYKKEDIIKSVKIENIQILENVNIGKIQVYMPNSLDDELYKYTNDFIVNSTLTYKGSQKDNKKALEIGNQGGCICISFANVGIDEFKSNENIEIEQGATILQKMLLKDEDLKFKISFDLLIEVQNKTYKGNIVLDLPVENLVGNKESHMEITDFNNVVFKRK